MNKNTKKMFIILGSVLALGLITIMPGFAETQEELAKIFVTRDEWIKWLKTDGGVGYQEYAKQNNVVIIDPKTGLPVKATMSDATGKIVEKPTETVGMSQYLETLEGQLIEIVQGKTKVEMTRRGMEETTTTTAAADAG